MVSDHKNFDSHPEALQLPLYVLGRLNQLEREALEQHLMGCTNCKKELEEEKLLQPAIFDALKERPKPSDRVLQRAKEKIAQVAKQQEEAQESSIDTTASWTARLEQWIRRLFIPRWVPALAVLVILIQGSALQYLLTSPSTTRPPGMEGPILHRELPPPTDSSTKIQRIQVRFSPDISLKDLQALLKEVQGTIVRGPETDGMFIIDLSYDSHEHLQKNIATLKAAKGIHNLEDSHQ